MKLGCERHALCKFRYGFFSIENNSMAAARNLYLRLIAITNELLQFLCVKNYKHGVGAETWGCFCKFSYTGNLCTPRNYGQE